jgi:amino acid transporter
MTVGLMIGILVIIGIVNCLNTRSLASLTQSFVFINVGTTIIIIIVLLATTGKSNMNSADFVFGSKGLLNGTGRAWPQLATRDCFLVSRLPSFDACTYKPSGSAF